NRGHVSLSVSERSGGKIDAMEVLFVLWFIGLHNKIWASTEDGSLEGILVLSGMTDPEVKPILHCSCSDKSVHLYELPAFTNKGRLLAKQEVQTLQIGPAGLFFTGD
ncbi:zinc finger ccch domain-containing protein 48, partial [Quercus suber]